MMRFFCHNDFPIVYKSHVEFEVRLVNIKPFSHFISLTIFAVAHTSFSLRQQLLKAEASIFCRDNRTLLGPLARTPSAGLCHKAFIRSDGKLLKLATASFFSQAAT